MARAGDPHRVIDEHSKSRNHLRWRRDDQSAADEDELRLTDRIVALAREYGRYGYRRVTALLQMEGWAVNHKRAQRIWRREGLKVPKKTKLSRVEIAK